MSVAWPKSVNKLCIIDQCIDQYTKLKQEEYNAKATGEMLPEIDPRLEEIVNRVIEDLNPTQYKTAVGIAIQTRRLDVLERTIKEAVSLRYSINSKFTGIKNQTDKRV